MSGTAPETVTEKLVTTANALISDWPPNEFAINKLRHDAETLRKASVAEYQMILGMCATMEGDIDGLRRHFESAIKTSGGDLDPIDNFAKSLVVWNYYDDACDVMRHFADRYDDSVRFLGTFFAALSSAGRFHEAAARYRTARKLGIAAENLLEKHKHLPQYSELVEDIDDNTIADAVTKFGQYLRNINATQIRSCVSALDEDDTGECRTGIEFQYFIRADEDDTAQLDFDGSLFLADAEIELVRNGIIVISIISDIENADVDRAA